MYSLEVIKAMNAEAGDRARAERPPLFPLGAGEVLAWPPKSAGDIPSIGDAESDYNARFTRIDTLFVDISGFGRDDEPALSFRQVPERMAELVAEHGPLLLGFVEFGQFQGYLGVWKASAE